MAPVLPKCCRSCNVGHRAPKALEGLQFWAGGKGGEEGWLGSHPPPLEGGGSLRGPDGGRWWRLPIHPPPVAKRGWKGAGSPPPSKVRGVGSSPQPPSNCSAPRRRALSLSLFLSLSLSLSLSPSFSFSLRSDESPCISQAIKYTLGSTISNTPKSRKPCKVRFKIGLGRAFLEPQTRWKLASRISA